MFPSARQSTSLMLSAASALIMLSGGLPRGVADETAQRVDHYGDPLPEGVVARLGTVRYRACAGSGRIEFLADGQTLLGCNERRLVWLDVPTGRAIQAVDVEGDYASLLCVTRDRSLAAVSTRTREPDEGEREFGLVIVETETGKVRTRLQLSAPTAFSSPQVACFTSDGRRLVTGDYEGVLRVWSVNDGREEQAHALLDSRDVQRIDISADDRWIIVSSYRSAYRWEWRSGDGPLQFGHPDDRIVTVEFSPDGRTVGMGLDLYEGVRLYDVETGRQIRRLTAPKRHYYPDQLAFTSDGSRIAAPSYHSLRGMHPELPGELDVWNVDSGELVHALPFEEGLRRVTISPDDRWIAASVYDGTIAVWDLASGESHGDRFFGHLNRFVRLTASHDGTQVATASSEGRVIVWDTETGQPVHILRHHPGKTVRALAFSPDGNLIATSAFDNSVVVWNRSTGERVYTLHGHGEIGGMRSVQFSTDSRRLMSFGDDWFLRVFDTGTGKAVLEHAIRPSGLSLKNNLDGSVNMQDDQRMFLSLTPNADFTSDGQTMVLSAGTDIYVFDVETGMERQRNQLEIANEQFALSPDGTRLATLTREQTGEPETGTASSRVLSVQITPLLTGEREHTISIPYEFAMRMVFSPDGTKLAMVGEAIRVYDISSGVELAHISPESRGNGVSFTANGNGLVVSHSDTTTLIWDWKQFLVNEEEEQ